MFYFGGPRPFTYSITGPSGTVNGSNAGFGAPISEVPIPAVYGNYHVTVTSTCECNSNVGYWVTWQDTLGNSLWISGYEMWFYGIQTKEDNFLFDKVPRTPPPEPFDFSISLSNHIVYGSQESVISFVYSGTTTNKSVSLHFEPADPGFEFYDRNLLQSVGATLTTTLDNSNNYSVKYVFNNGSYPKHVNVIAVSNNLQRQDTLLVAQPPTPTDSLKVKITLTGDKNIWPELPKGQIIAGYKPTTNAKIKVTKGNQPLTNQEVNLKLSMVDGTGGHDHIPPTFASLPVVQSGKIRYHGRQANPQILTTDENGEALTEEILASEFGGKYILEAALKSNPGIKDTVHIFVRVPGLDSLEQNSIYYKLTGTPDKYYCQSQPTSKHYSNHFGIPKLITAIKKISYSYYFYSRGTKTLINDMSLVYGGKFDVNNLWSGDHAEHKLGKNADISFKGVDANNECIYIKQEIMEELFSKYADGILLKHTVKNPHYHLRVK